MVENRQRSDSYEQRVCDDLSEELLKYLSLEDRLRLECLSKQFQRTIYSRMKDIELHVIDCDNISLHNLATIVRRCRNKKLKLTVYEVNNRLVIDTIFENTQCLTDFVIIGWIKIDGQCVRKLVDKFGPQLRSISLQTLNSQTFFSRIPNIEELRTDLFYSELSSIHFPRLKRFEVFYFGDSDRDVDQLDRFAANHSKTITHLNLFCQNLREESQFRKLLKAVSKLKELVHFSTGTCPFRINEKQFDKELRRIALNCSHLKSVCLTYGIERYKQSTAEIDLSSLKLLPNLSRLEITVYSHNFLKPEQFNGFHKLTHLKLLLAKLRTVDEDILHEFDINLPNLKSLYIHRRFRATERTADILSRLSGLESIRLQIRDESIRSMIKNKLIDNCKHIKDIQFS